MNSKVNELNLVFSTPIWAFLIDNHDDINVQMLNYIKDLQKKDTQGIKRSNLSGWHSNSFDMENKSVLHFFKSIQVNLNKAIVDMGWNKESNEFKVTSAWSIINKKNSSNSRHIHSNNYISAAYYVKAPTNCGDIIFYDPRDAKVVRKPEGINGNNLNADTVNITPQEGLLVLFPSYLYHSVNENQSDDERVVISFNVDIKNT